MKLDGQINSISDVNYAEELQLQEALMASLALSPGYVASPVDQGGPSQQRPEEAEHVRKLDGQIISMSDVNYPHELQLQEALMASLDASLSPGDVATPVDQGFCEICREIKENDLMFTVKSCKHSFCNDCISKHVETKVMDSVHDVKCPAVDCKDVLEFDSCTSFAPKEALAKWNEVLCRSSILDWLKCYCPYNNCSALLLRDSDEVIRESECPECRRLFCAQCRVPWHSEIGCEEFQKLNEDEREREDIMLLALAKQKKWKTCPGCKIIVEKTQGCLHMSCRCGFEFCYACGETWTPTHGGCQ